MSKDVGSPLTKLWSGKFGNEYTRRNRIAPADRKDFFAHVLSRTFGVTSVCELGANRGQNLLAIRLLSRNYRLAGVETNIEAFKCMSANSGLTAINSSIQKFSSRKKFDLVFMCGVLIHIHPSELENVFRKIFALSNRYVLFNEYFSPTPIEIEYRKKSGMLFKRDFGGDFMDLFESKISLVDYGFLWKRENPAWDNTTWWLFEKTPALNSGDPC